MTNQGESKMRLYINEEEALKVLADVVVEKVTALGKKRDALKVELENALNDDARRYIRNDIAAVADEQDKVNNAYATIWGKFEVEAN